MNLFLTMNIPFGSEAMKTFNLGLNVLWVGMTAVIGMLFIFYLIVKLLIKLFPGK